MKEVALLCAVVLLAGCSTSTHQSPLRDSLYVGMGYPPDGSLSTDNVFFPIRDALIAAHGKPVVESQRPETSTSGPVEIHVGHNTMKHLDLEATLYATRAPHEFVSLYTLYDQRFDNPPHFGLHAAAVIGELNESGVMLTALPKWNFNEYFGVFARLGGSYTQSDFEVTLGEEDLSRYGCGSNIIDPNAERTDCGSITVSRVKYRSDGFSPVWGIGISIADMIRIEYQTRQIPAFNDSETLHTLLIALQIGLKHLRE